jgi:ubiquinone/menaquinone biosynthesis C-methylase UbiE
MPAATATADQYFLGHGPAEQRRLQRQAEQLAGEAAWLLDRVGPLEGRRAVELGTGPRGYLDALSERVGWTGTVVGVERSADAVALARLLVARRGLANVQLLHGDARSTRLPGASFDLAIARLVLVNVPRPEQIVAEAVRLTRPGGTVAFHEADALSEACDPPHPAWTRLRDLLNRYAALNDIDPFVGRRLPRLLRDAGLADINAHPIVHTHEPGHPRRTLLPDFVDNLGERLIANGLTTAHELDRLQAQLRRHLQDPHTLDISQIYIQAWGHKPTPP